MRELAPSAPRFAIFIHGEFIAKYFRQWRALALTQLDSTLVFKVATGNVGGDVGLLKQMACLQ